LSTPQAGRSSGRTTALYCWPRTPLSWTLLTAEVPTGTAGSDSGTGLHPPLEGGCRGTGVDRLGGTAHAAGDGCLEVVEVAVVDRERSTGVEHDGVARRTGLTGQHPSYDVGVVGDVAPAEVVGG